MLVSDAITRISNNLEDSTQSLYASTEVLEAFNMAKDDVLLSLGGTSQTFNQATEIITFAPGDKEKELASVSLGIIRCERADSPYTEIPITDFRGQDDLVANTQLFVRVGSDGKRYLCRRFNSDVLSVKVYYLTDISDMATTASILFIPRPAINLLITKTTNLLFGRRNRVNQYFINLEGQQEEIFNRYLSSLKSSRPRYTKFIPV